MGKESIKRGRNGRNDAALRMANGAGTDGESSTRLSAAHGLARHNLLDQKRNQNWRGASNPFRDSPYY